MRSTTLIIQLVCVALGCVFIYFAHALSEKVLYGGWMLGSLMFMAAALLSADTTTHPTAARRTRAFFKTLAVVAALPMLGFGIHGLWLSATQGAWSEAASLGIKLLVVALALLALAFDDRAQVRGALRRLGIATPDQQPR